ncbi:MAG: hypothetical protein LAO51_16065 [Acidobacteriia bacterium]|nr:hypothetical protein [Terriglobia bacterium]
MKALLLLAAGAVLSVAAGAIWPTPWPLKVSIAVIVVTLVIAAYASDAPAKSWRAIEKLRRRARWLPPRVGVLCDLDSDPNNPETFAWTIRSPSQWVDEIKKLAVAIGTKIHVKQIEASSSFEPYSAVLNPYGGVYPELEPDALGTLNKIADYVNRGGLFVNVADIPCYWSHNPRINRKIDATPFMGFDEAGRPIRPFWKSPIVEKLGLWIRKPNADDSNCTVDVELADKFAHIDDDLARVRVDRMVVCERNVEPIFRPIRVGDLSFTTFFFAGYGKGRFLISLLFMGATHPENKGMPRLIGKVLLDAVSKYRS